MVTDPFLSFGLHQYFFNPFRCNLELMIVDDPEFDPGFTRSDFARGAVQNVVSRFSTYTDFVQSACHVP